MPNLSDLFTAGGFLKWDGAGNADADYSSQAASDLAADAAFTGAFAPLSARGSLYLPGVSGTTVGCPDSAAISVVADLEVEIWAALDDWTPSAAQCLIGKTNAGASQRSWHVEIGTTGLVTLSGSSNGSGATNAVSTAAPVVANGDWLGIKVTRNKATGDVKFYTANAAAPATWTQLGATVAGWFTATNLFDSTARITIGALDNNAGIGSILLAAGRFGRAYVRDGIDGPVVASHNPDLAYSDRYRDPLGNTWTLNGGSWAWSDFG